MNKEQAIEFLRQHQPMPNDEILNNDPQLIADYNRVREYFTEHPDVEAVPLLLNSFGEGSGFGLYQLIEDAIIPLPKNEVLFHLMASLESESQSVRYWTAQISANFPDALLIEPLSHILANDDLDGRSAAVTALGLIQDERVDGILQQTLKKEPDGDLQELSVDTIQSRNSAQGCHHFNRPRGDLRR